MEPDRAAATLSGVAAAPGGGRVILGKYELCRLLGRGSFAKVYQARSLSDNSYVAVKVIDKAKSVDAAMEPRIIREVAAMRRLSSHSNILKIHEVLATKTKIYLVMELARGGDFAGELRRRGGRMPESTARRYLWQLATALHFCHQNGVAHRDIKPQNLLLDENRNLKISDFGLAALPEQQRNGLVHTACGTPAFVAPEVVVRRGYDGAAADAWSCGVIFFLFLTGDLPFDDSNLRTMYRQIQRRELNFPSWISKQSKSLIRQLLDPNPNTRMSIETLINHPRFKKSPPPSSECFVDSSLAATKPDKFGETEGVLNAFDIISLSSGLDLSGLFEATSNGKRERRFTSNVAAEEVEKRVEEVGQRLGYKVERRKGRVIGLEKGRTVLLAEIMVVAPEVELLVVVVVMKVVEGGGEFKELDWDELKAGFGDMAVTWHTDGS
ncbi:Non-specific serine/threonine protein kinase [Bertholletia excelsa]